MSSTADEIGSLIESNLDEWGWSWDDLQVEDDLIFDGLPGIFTVQPVDVRAGQELREVILCWRRPDVPKRFFRQSGCYTSYDGHIWDGTFDEVFPREVVKVEWVPA